MSLWATLQERRQHGCCLIDEAGCCRGLPVRPYRGMQGMNCPICATSLAARHVEGVPVPAYIYLAWWFLMQLLFSVFDSPVAYFAHIGGFLVGAIAAVAYRTGTKRQAAEPDRHAPRALRE